MSNVTDEAMKRWGLTLEVNQAGPLLEQMARQWSVVVDWTVYGRYSVAWRGEVGVGDSVLVAALNCIQEKHEAMA